MPPATSTQMSATAVTDRQPLVNACRTRLIKAISDISMKAPSALRGYLDSYARHVSPSCASNNDTMFPQTVKRHPRNKANTTHEGTNANLLAYIGITLLYYYDVVNAATTPLDELEARVKLIESIADLGTGQFHVVGSVATGFTLEKKPDPRKVVPKKGK